MELLVRDTYVGDHCDVLGQGADRSALVYLIGWGKVRMKEEEKKGRGFGGRGAIYSCET
jgi:hypothetical protein